MTVINYICKNCNKIADAPTHCGRIMEFHNEDGKMFFSCWKGEHAPCCGKASVADFEVCCDNVDIVKNEATLKL